MLPSWSITVPIPPGVNQMYNNRSQAGRRGRIISPAYVAWRNEAEAVLWQNCPLPFFKDKVAVCIAVEEPKGLADIDGKIKACCDLLVRNAIIRGDDRRYLRMVIASWDKTISGARITVSEME